MKNTSDVKENIIQAATELIQQSNGNTAEITTRTIARKAKVGIGLINYHFQSKENLIAICVQRIIGEVVSGFSPAAKIYENDRERLTDWALQVFEFLFEHPSISRISILSDLSGYSMDSNSVKTQKGFLFAMKKDVKEADKNLLSFLLTSAMQTAFLGSKTGMELLGYDLNTVSGRKDFMERLVSLLFDGFSPASLEKSEEGMLSEDIRSKK